MKKSSVIIFFLSILLLYTSCFPPIHQDVLLYPEAGPSNDKKAFLLVDNEMCWFLPEKIDDYNVSGYFGMIAENRLGEKMGYVEHRWITVNFHLMPGEHTIAFGSHLESGETDQIARLEPPTIKFQALPGHQYSIESYIRRETIKTEPIGIRGDKYMYREYYKPYGCFHLADITANSETIFAKEIPYTFLK